MTHDPGPVLAGSSMASEAHAPRTRSSSGGCWIPRRLVNQAESGTSSRALTLIASAGGSTANTLASGRKRVLSAASHARGETYFSGAQAMCCGSFSVGGGSLKTERASRSVSRHSGSRKGKRFSLPLHAPSAQAQSTREAVGRLLEAMGRPQQDSEGVDLAARRERLRADAEENL